MGHDRYIVLIRIMVLSFSVVLMVERGRERERGGGQFPAIYQHSGYTPVIRMG